MLWGDEGNLQAKVGLRYERILTQVAKSRNGVWGQKLPCERTHRKVAAVRAAVKATTGVAVKRGSGTSINSMVLACNVAKTAAEKSSIHIVFLLLFVCISLL